MIQVDFSKLNDHELLEKSEELRRIGIGSFMPMNYEEEPIASGIVHVYWRRKQIGIAIGKSDWQAGVAAREIVRLNRARPEAIRKWMRGSWREFVDEMGEHQSTLLAEAAADVFHCEDFLSDPDHWIWDLAAEDYA